MGLATELEKRLMNLGRNGQLGPNVCGMEGYVYKAHVFAIRYYDAAMWAVATRHPRSDEQEVWPL